MRVAQLRESLKHLPDQARIAVYVDQRRSDGSPWRCLCLDAYFELAALRLAADQDVVFLLGEEI